MRSRGLARRRSKGPALGLRPKEPRAATVSYLAALRRVWGVCSEIIATGLEPLLELWPGEERADAPTAGRWVGAPQPLPVQDMPIVRGPQSVYPAGARARPRQYVSPGPFGPPLRRRVSDLTDAELRQLWPGLDPQDVRRYAPWATSREEVYRLAFPAGTPIREGEAAVFDLQSRVQRAIEAERRAERTVVPGVSEGRPIEILEPRRPPWAFRARHPVFTPSGEILIPPRPGIVSALTIRRQVEWCDLALHQVVTVTNLQPIVDGSSGQVSAFSSRETGRVLGIDVRQVRQGDALMGPLINAWREANINLIESGIMAGRGAPRLRPSLLADVSRMIEDAHARGLRVEALAGALEDRFGVGRKRAELIARDQVLKLNAQISRSRQQAVGVREYIWSTSRDERVRDMHLELEDTRQSYDNPPEIAPGRYGHPGDDYQCRCTAIPVMPERDEEEESP